MKIRFSHLIIFLLINVCSVQINLAQQEPSIGTVSEEVKEIVDQTEQVDYRLNTDIKAMFDHIRKAINDANKISAQLNKKSNERKNLDDEKQKAKLRKALQEIYEIYNSIDEKRGILYDLLTNYDKTIDAQVVRADILIEKYRDKLEENESKTRQLIRSIENENGSDMQEILALKGSILKRIINHLGKIEYIVEDVQSDYNVTNNKISYLFDIVRESKETTKLLMDLVDIVAETDKIIENAERINMLDELINDIASSLENLSTSVMNLKDSAQILP